MHFKIYLLFSISTSLSTVYASKGTYLKCCASKDKEICPTEVSSDINMSDLAQGIPDLGISAVEPMFFKNITMDQGHFKIHCPNMKLTGTKNCKITKFLRDTTELTLTISFDCPFQATGKYKFQGGLSIFKIENEGKYIIESESVKSTLISKMEKYDAYNGKSYWKLLSYDYSYEPIEKIYMSLDNLFTGSIGISQPYLSFFTENWWISAIKVGDPIANAIYSAFFEGLKEFYLHVSVDELNECAT